MLPGVAELGASLEALLASTASAASADVNAWGNIDLAQDARFLAQAPRTNSGLHFCAA